MSTATYKNLAGFSAERIALLEQDFAALDEAGAGLAERAVRYIVDGEDADVLAAVAKSKRPAERLRLNHDLRIFQAKVRDGEARLKFFETVEPVGFEPYLRLARLFEAAAQGGPPVVLPFQAFYGGLPWLELFLQEIWLLQALSATPGGDERKLAMPLPLVEQMLEAEGQDPARLIRAVFSPLRQEPIQSMPAHVISRLPGFAESVVKHREIVAAALLEAGSPRKVELLHMLSTSGAPPQPFVAELVRLWLGPAKTVREWTSRLLTKVRDEARPHFEQAALAGSPAQRAAAIDWLGRNAREASREFLLARREAEKSAKLQDAINEALGEVKQEAPAPQSDAPAPRPPLPAVEKKAPLTPSSRQAVVALIEAYNRAATDVNQQRAKHRQQYPAHTAPDLPLYGESQLELLCRRLELADLTEFLSREPEFLANSREFFDRVLDFAAHPDVRLIQLIRLLGLVGWITERHWGRPAMLGMTQEYLKRFQKTHPPGFTAPELAAALDAVGVDDRVIGYDLLSGFFGRHAWLSEGIESYFAAHLDLLEDGLDNRPLTGSFAFEWRHVRTRTLEVVSKFEQLPPALVGRIWQLAIGAGKSDRSAAQQIMERFPDLPQRLADALASGDYPTRVVAAEWLGRSGGKHAAGLLHKALAKEKQDAAKDAMLTALERLGESIEPYLDRGKLLAEAERGLKKGLHKDLDWFPSHSWPDVRWADSGKPVPQEILNWLLAQTHKLGSPEPGALLRRYCQQFAAEDRAALGEFVLTQWIEQDTRRKYTEAQARLMAQQEAQTIYSMAQQYANSTKSLEAYEELCFQGIWSQCVGSAAKQKGILALAAACCGEGAVKIAGDFLKQWYGYRAAQCRALVVMLASLEHSAAIQLLLSVAGRFRTKSIREEAEKQVKLLAERKGWTVDELADRTVPTAGFDETLSLELDYGPRQFTARLRPDLSITLVDADGKPLKTLPEPRKDDDADLAQAAKKTFSTAKSELKKLVSQQTSRLYEAMCTERTWNYADWDAYVYQHPIVRGLCQRLVWAVVDGDGPGKMFRPLDDGTLTDEQDEQVAVPGDARLRLAHGSLVSAETSAAWQQHLADYQVEPLFAQFGRGRYALTDDKQDVAELSDFEGHLIEAFKLRGLATRLGYTRGPTGDGGWFYEYEKTLAGLGLKVVLRFSGNGLPEENRTVALIGMHFSPTGGDSGGMAFDRPGIPLREAPSVLLSECYHELQTIAAAGSGYDPDWQRKVEP